MFASGRLIALFTFPGVIIHEYSHKKFCDITKTPVYAVKYFQFSKKAGYVRHGQVRDLKSAFLITVGPLIINTIVCLILPFIGFLIGINNLFSLLVVWIGVSAGMHAFPSNQDTSNFMSEFKDDKDKHSFIYYSSVAFTGLIWLANILRIFWFDLLYALFVALLLPVIFGFY
jgi:hypothetical protein